jgi:hypothetical protein
LHGYEGADHRRSRVRVASQRLCWHNQSSDGDAGAGVGGGAANLLSKGNPIVTAAGAAGGVLLGETLNYANENNANKARLEGYNKGRSDAVKQQYWIRFNQQEAAEGQSFDENISLFDIPIAEQLIDGVILKPTTKTLRIEE